MRLLTFLGPNGPRPGLLAGGRVFDLSEFAGLQLGPERAHLGLLGIIAAGPELWATLERHAARSGESGLDLAEVQLLAPVPNPSKVVAIGVNYEGHIRETGHKRPASPILFAKFTTSVIGPDADICWDPALTGQVDWEAELAVVIGRAARRVGAAQADEYIFGYTAANDVTARDLQFGDGQWVRGKSLDTFCPIGPWIVTSDEIPDPHDLAIRCRVNGETVQDARTDQLIQRIPQLIEFLSASFTLLPGDIILTGTPAGVGHFRTPPRYLHDGDEVAVEVEGIGTLINRCREEMLTGKP